MNESLEISRIRVDGGTQPRAWLDPHTVDEYSQAMKEGSVFPPVTIYNDGNEYWLADGFHRIKAARGLGRNTIDANVCQGTRRDAILHSVGANATHGLRRTNADKRRAVETLLRDDEWRTWSDREIARRCAVNDKTVAKVRAELCPVTADFRSENQEPRTYTTKHGTQATMNTERIGRRQEPGSGDGGRTRTADDNGPSSWVDLGQFYEDRDDGPQPKPRSESAAGPYANDVDYQSRILKLVVDQSLEEIPDATVRHEVVNNLLKYLRELSVRFNREGAAV